ncbi:MAG: DNA-binding protein [Bacteroidetes bacterium B1(2017)]|nr:MAG: DNA-binding protein [Bacteroidetes bacterium B1(2017)]
MKSPITGKEMKLTKERRSMDFRKETIEIVFHFYKCEDSEEQFTTTELDEVNLNQIYNQYRDKYHIPFPDEISRIREKYSVSAVKMSEILGLGINSYRQYEAGEMPSVANAKLIQMVDDPKVFMEMIQLCATIDDKTKAKYIDRAQLIADEKNKNLFELNFKEYLLGKHLADIYSGYRNPNLEKFSEMVVYFSEKLSPFKTKMNKLLFYADFLMFKQSCFSISGVRYKAINMGPVPTNFQSIFEYLANTNTIDIFTTEFQQGYTGEQFRAREERPFNAFLFTRKELETLEKVASIFKETSTNEIILKSHLEEAWKQNEKDKSIISYKYAFDLTN